MWRSVVLAKLVKQVSALGTITAPTLSYGYRTTVQDQRPIRRNGNAMPSSQDEFNNKINSQQHFQNDTNDMPKRQVGHSVSRANKIDFLLKTLMDLPNSKEDAYGALDAWVAWEESFPIGPLRKALIVLQKEEEWHKIIQVIKWILSKGQGTTMGVYGLLIKALDKDQRAEEAHEVWVKKVGTDSHSVPWELCELMISVYYRNNMLEQLVILFKGLEAFDRKPRCKKTVKKVADAYGLLGLLEEKECVLEKYKNLFTETGQGSPKAKNKKKEKLVQGIVNELENVVKLSLEYTINNIKWELGELEGENFVRLKKIQGFKKREIEKHLAALLRNKLQRGISIKNAAHNLLFAATHG